MKLITSAIIQWLPLLLLFSSTMCLSETTPSHKIPRLTPHYESILQRSSSKHPSKAKPLSPHFKTYYYKQTLDHFNYGPQSYATFNQRYIMSTKFWGGAKSNSPIFAWLGAESPIDDDPSSVGVFTDNAPRFKALLLYIEHRYYGKSIPFGSMEGAMKNETTRGYFNSAQALADYAEVLLYIKKKYSAQHSPIIVFGGSYGGMLASWFRLKYPHVALGALASSAPILYFDNIVTPQNGYYSVATKDFREVSESCYQTIRKSWSIIDKIASKPNGLSILRRKFKLCEDLKSSGELKSYLDAIYTEAAQYDHPPKYPVTVVCGGIDGAPKGADILDRIFAGFVAIEGNQSCYSIIPANGISGWYWQTCSEMVMPLGHREGETMFYPNPFNIQKFTQDCINHFGVPPRPHWITTYYGGHDIKLILHKFGSNIIFSNGLRDPYSSGGVLEDISDTVLAVYTRNGSHCLDIFANRETDPDWLTEQRKKEVEIIQRWITKYYSDLQAFTKKKTT